MDFVPVAVDDIFLVFVEELRDENGLAGIEIDDEVYGLALVDDLLDLSGKRRCVIL